MFAFLSYIFPGLLGIALTVPVIPVIWKKKEYASIAILVLFILIIIAGAVASWMEYVLGLIV